MSNMLDMSHEENQSHSSAENHEETHDSVVPILSVADFNGDGSVNNIDIEDLTARSGSVEGEDLYHPLYDLNANGTIDDQDLTEANNDLGADVPLLDQQIAQATQATMKYYGSEGLEQAIADGYIPSTQEAMGHGIHYYNPTLANEIGNSAELDIERPVGLNFDNEGNLTAVFYLRFPGTEEATPENPLAGLMVNPADNFPPSSFDSLTADDWHHHHNAWITGLGNLNSELVYFEEDVPLEIVGSRLEQLDYKVFPESDQFFNPEFWMLHGWFHSFNPDGTFAITNPNEGLYALEELGAHGGHFEDNIDPLIAGTDAGEGLQGTEANDRINGFDGDDWLLGKMGDDSIWGGHGNDWIRGDDDYTCESGDDMLYGGPGHDLIYGHGGSDRIFGGTENDRLVAGTGDDLLRGSLGYDILTGDEGHDSFVIAAGEGTDLITDFELEFDTLVLYTGVSSQTIAVSQLDNNTVLSFADETLAVLNGVSAEDLLAVKDHVFLDV
jgi:hypothetical protein